MARHRSHSIRNKLRLAFLLDTVRFVNQSGAMPVITEKWRRVLFVTGTSVRNRLTKNPNRIYYRIEIGFEGDDRRDGLASRFFTRKRNDRSPAVPAHTNTVFGGI